MFNIYVQSNDTGLKFRNATERDLSDLTHLLADHELGPKREDTSLPMNQSYFDGFHSIGKDPNNELIVVEPDGAQVGMLQLTFISYLTHIGSWRCLIEGIRIDREFRGQGCVRVPISFTGLWSEPDKENVR